MKSYSGTASFEFEVERYKSIATGELVTADDYPNDAEESDYEYQLIKLNVEGSSYFAPGRMYGLPENCYPDEGETEITSVIGPDGKDWSDKLSNSENDLFLEMIAEQANEGCEPDEPDYDDRCDSDYA
jgi:hypothetical protein